MSEAWHDNDILFNCMHGSVWCALAICFLGLLPYGKLVYKTAHMKMMYSLTEQSTGPEFVNVQYVCRLFEWEAQSDAKEPSGVFCVNNAELCFLL